MAMVMPFINKVDNIAAFIAVQAEMNSIFSAQGQTDDPLAIIWISVIIEIIDDLLL